MAAIYPTADIFVLSSDYEGIPNVVLEAMAAGLPIVATRVGSVADVCQHGEAGFLVAPEDETGLVEALVRLVRQPQLRREMGARARARAEEHYSLNQLPDLLTNLYRQALR